MRSVCAGLTVPEKKEQMKRIEANTQKFGANASTSSDNHFAFSHFLGAGLDR